jgi:hypothetical protein
MAEIFDLAAKLCKKILVLRLPSLVCGGSGRAGGAKEMGGMRGVKHYLQRTAIQGSDSVTAISNVYNPCNR